jgi:hypothetical protein
MSTGPGRGLLVALLWCALVVPGCKKDEKDENNKQASGEAPLSTRPVPPPEQVAVYLGLKNPGRTIDDALALVGQLAPLPFNRAGLLDLLAQRARLPREMVEAIDVDRPLWLAGLDDRKIENDTDPLVMVIPIRSRKAFESALDKKLKRAKADGKLTVYEPKPGAAGVHPVRLRLTDRHAIAATSRAAYETVEAFVGGLTRRTPRHDLTVHVMVQHLLKARGKDLDRRVDQAMNRIRADMERRKGPIDRKRVAEASEKTLRRWLETLKSTRELRITADVNKEQLTLALRAAALEKGRLAGLIKRQRPGQPLGHALLPASSWLVLSDRSNPEAAAENLKTWKPLISEMLKGLAPKKQAALVDAVEEAAKLFTGDYSVALHRAPVQKDPTRQGGLTCSVVGKIADRDRALATQDKLVAALGGWIEGVLARSREKVPRGLKVQRRPFSRGKARGTLFELNLALSPEKREQLHRVLGEPLTLGAAYVGDLGLFTLGKGAEAQLGTLAAGAESGKTPDGLAKNPAFERARASGTERVGLLYLSLVDLLRWFEGTGFEEIEKMAAALKGQKVTAAPSLDWGVDAKRTELDLTLRLPVSHFRPFVPIFKALQRRGGIPGLMGAKRPGWEKF